MDGSEKKRKPILLGLQADIRELNTAKAILKTLPIDSMVSVGVSYPLSRYRAIKRGEIKLYYPGDHFWVNIVGFLNLRGCKIVELSNESVMASVALSKRNAIRRKTMTLQEAEKVLKRDETITKKINREKPDVSIVPGGVAVRIHKKIGISNMALFLDPVTLVWRRHRLIPLTPEQMVKNFGKLGERRRKVSPKIDLLVRERIIHSRDSALELFLPRAGWQTKKKKQSTPRMNRRLPK